MNPFNAYSKNCPAVCFTTAVIYAFALGNQPMLIRLTDGFIYGCLLGFAGIVLWYIFKFVMPRLCASVYSVILMAGLAVLTSLLTVGIETFVLYICYPAAFPLFIPTIPARIFATFLLFALLRLFYLLRLHRQPTMNQDKHREDKAATQPTDRITVSSGQKIRLIQVSEIIYIQAEGDYISIHTSEGKWLKEQTMKYTETILPPENFIRVHRSYIVNINHISRIERYGEQQQITLHNREQIKISAARYQSLKELLSI
ncbi:MAG: LytTR family transcriptional regulator DNA-binding domain-containing protein [Tannerella sp.]|jgi:preprotein translocase subunit YajC|nr:LytTR family transcriptional regulator DNA-binding domain-containing protein [Tannerella sp.]